VKTFSKFADYVKLVADKPHGCRDVQRNLYKLGQCI